MTSPSKSANRWRVHGSGGGRRKGAFRRRETFVLVEDDGDTE
jgi:hypothetical protein